MSLVKDGFYKAIGGVIGSNSYVLLAGGNHIAWGNGVNQIPYSNGAVNSNLNADMVDNEHASAFAHRQTWNNMIHSGNEYTWIAPAYSGGVWINYRTASGNTDGNITEYIFGKGNGSALATLNSTGTILTSSNWTSIVDGRYLPLAGGTMTGTPYINMPASAASISNNQPFGITYGRIQGYGDMYINADTDGSTSEYVHITAGYVAGTSGVSYGLGIGYYNLYWKGGVLFANTSNVGIGTTSPQTKLHVEGNELVSGTSLMAYSIKILPTVYSELKTSYGLASDYESRYDTEEFLKSWVKWAYANGAGYTVQSYISPNSRGYIVADVYTSGINSSTGYPEHITGRYYPHSGTEIIFGTSYGNWYYRTGIDSGNISSQSVNYATYTSYPWVAATSTSDRMYLHFSYYGDTWRQTYVYSALSFQPSQKHLWVSGGFDVDPTKYDDGNDRPGISITGNYPQLSLISHVDNSSHGAVLSIGAYDSAWATSGGFKTFRIGTRGYDATWLDIAYGTSANVHDGIAGWNASGNGVQIMRLHNNRTIYSYGTHYFGVASYGATYYHSGYTVYSYDKISHYSYTYGSSIIGDSSMWNWTLGVNGRVGIATNDATDPGYLNISHNTFAINFRQGGSWTTGFYYGTYGNEFLALTTQQIVTSIIFANGYHPNSLTSGSFISNDSGHGYGTSTDIIQIKQNCMSIGNVWHHGVSPDYKLRVYGRTYINYTGGDTDPSLTVIASSNGSWRYVAAFLAPNLTDGYNVYVPVGQSMSTRNAIGLTHYHYGSGSTSNYAAMEIWGVGNIQRWYYGDMRTWFAGRVDASGFYHNSYGSSNYFLTSDGGARYWPDLYDNRYYRQYSTTNLNPGAGNGDLWCGYGTGMSTQHGIETGGWYHIWSSGWSDNSSWMSQIAVPTIDYWDSASMWYRQCMWGSNYAWRRILDQRNYRASYQTWGGTTYIQILINSATSWMLSFKVRVYQSYSHYDLVFSGYNYGDNYWYSPQVRMSSGTVGSVTCYFGYDSPWNLWVAIPGGSYTGVEILEVSNGYTPTGKVPGDLFTIRDVGSLGNVQSTQTAYQPWSMQNRPYWANIQVSDSPSTSTWPTFGSAYSYDWWRSYNATGWYNETYGGGIWMNDSTYVRVYNSKRFWTDATGHFSSNSESAWPGEAAIEVRERSRGTTGISHNYANAPRIGFHWGNRYWANFTYFDGRFRTMTESCGGYVPMVSSQFSLNDYNGNYHSTNNISGLAGEIWFGGNFHLDSQNGYNMYLNYYTGATVSIAQGGGNVGIGTDGPGYRLDVRGTGRFTDRIYSNEWIQFDNWTGLYSPNNGAHFYPNNTTSYGAWQLRGSRNGYGGIHFGDSTHYMTVMDNYTDKGIYQQDQRWILYYNANNGCVSLRDSGNWTDISLWGNTWISGTLYSGGGHVHVGYNSSSWLFRSDGGMFYWPGAYDDRYLRYEGWWNSGSGQNVDDAHGMVFAYGNHNRPGNWGIVATFEEYRGSPYRLQLAGDGWDNCLYFRNRSSDRGGWHTGWQRVYCDNYRPYADHCDWSDRTAHLLINGTTWWSNWYWSGQSGQPTWLWGSNDGTNMYVWNPSNFSVAYAQRAAYLDGHGVSPDNSHPGYGARIFYSWNIGQAYNNSSGYSNGISIGSHPGDTYYGFQIVQNMWDDNTYTRRYQGGWLEWKTLLNNSNWSSYISLYWANIQAKTYADSWTEPSFAKITLLGGSIEIHGTNPFIDFHGSDYSGDYRSRLINWGSNNRLTHESITYDFTGYLATVEGNSVNIVCLGVFDLYKSSDNGYSWTTIRIAGMLSYASVYNTSSNDGAPVYVYVYSNYSSDYSRKGTPKIVSAIPVVQTRWINGYPRVVNWQTSDWAPTGVECCVMNSSSFGSNLSKYSSGIGTFTGQYIAITSPRPWGYDSGSNGMGMDGMRCAGNATIQRIRITLFGYMY